jgi:hypothetical protein
MKKKVIFCFVLKVTDEKSRSESGSVRAEVHCYMDRYRSEEQVASRNKVSWILETKFII